MRNLEGISYCNKGEVALCEVEGRLRSMEYNYANISTFTNAVERHPRIRITRDMLHPLSTGDESKALFLPVHEPFFKRVTKVWYEEGFTEALQLTAESQINVPYISLAATWMLKFVKFFSKIRSTISPQMYKNNKQVISTFTQVRDWNNSPVRYIAWHPHCTKLAIAASDDSVRIYSIDSTLVPVLKSKLQRGVSCVAWRPLSASEIAVACETCILIWTVDPNSVVTRPSTANSFILSHVNHYPVISLAWSPQGEYLISAAVSDSSLLVWDVAMDQTCSLKRAGTLGNAHLCFSKDGSKLLAASSGLVFRVWECKTWNVDRWNVLSGRVQTACWSPCGSTLLFATSEEPILYSLCFTVGMSVFMRDITETSSLATPIIDLSRIELPNGEITGGLVQSIDWDPKGRHLAVLFQECMSIAVFSTIVSPSLQVIPSCLVSGFPGEWPNAISFQKNFQEGSCLTIAWSSGRIQYFPLIYADIQMQNSSFNFSKLDASQSGYLSF